MKIKVFLLAIVCVGATIQSNAQSDNNHSVKKGYYNIGNNSKKLMQGSNVKAMQTVPTTAAKGYYSIRSNKNKPLWRYKINENAAAREPIRKGYYSIGRNAEKLK